MLNRDEYILALTYIMEEILYPHAQAYAASKGKVLLPLDKLVAREYLRRTTPALNRPINDENVYEV